MLLRQSPFPIVFVLDWIKQKTVRTTINLPSQLISVMSVLYRIVSARLNPPKPSHGSFAGQTILITGATGGLGLEAAKKLAVHGATTLIITARDEKKGAKAKAAVEEHLESMSPNPNQSINIIPLVLEMTEPSSIHAFIDTLKSHTTNLDQAILNAGIVPMSHTMSASYESTIRVNTVSTILLSLLLLPFLLASPLTAQASVNNRPHLSFISSGTAWGDTLLQSWYPHSSEQNPMAALSKPEAFAGFQQYARSKLLLEMCFRPIASLPSLLSDPSDPKSSPKVLVTSTCPGMTRTDLGRGLSEKGWLITVLAKLVMFLIAHPAQTGANTYLTSLEVGAEAKGEMWKDDRVWIEESEKNIRSKEATEVGERVWSEMSAVAEREDATGVVEAMLGEEKKEK